MTRIALALALAAGIAACSPEVVYVQSTPEVVYVTPEPTSTPEPTAPPTAEPTPEVIFVYVVVPPGECDGPFDNVFKPDPEPSPWPDRPFGGILPCPR